MGILSQKVVYKNISARRDAGNSGANDVERRATRGHIWRTFSAPPPVILSARVPSSDAGRVASRGNWRKNYRICPNLLIVDIVVLNGGKMVGCATLNRSAGRLWKCDRETASTIRVIGLGPRKMRLVCTVSAITVGAITLISGCRVDSTPPPPANPVEVTVNIPTINPQPETQYRQVKSGLEITIAPETYKVEQKEVNTYTEHPTTDFDSLWFGDHPTYVYYTKTTKSVLTIVPDRLTFILHVNNQMARVFHGGGAVAEFKIGGQEVPVYEAGYSDLENAIVPPRNGLDIRIYGPKLSDLPSEGGTMGIFLFDLVTGQNDAGAVTEKQNFQWYFDFKTTAKSANYHLKLVRSFIAQLGSNMRLP